MWRICLAFALCTGTASTAEGATPWATLALRDLQAIHDTLRDNHPAPVDPSAAAAPYKRWLEVGLTEADARAADARSFAQYQRVLQFYTNGFRDGHISISADVDSTMDVWTGFVVGGQSTDDAAVVEARGDAVVKVNDRLISCDGKTVDDMLKERTDPYYWNADIPHSRFAQLYRLFYQSLSDQGPRSQHCVFASGPVDLAWRPIRATELQPILQAARGRGTRELRLQKMGDVWLISIPTFNFPTHDDLEKASSFAAALRSHAKDFEKATIVLDVRGNGGGDSGWGETFAAALWGKNWVDRVEHQFDDTVDWRVSELNIRALEVILGRSSADSRSFAELKSILTGMKAALANHQTFYRTGGSEVSDDNPAPTSPLQRHVYFFTDSGCGSACLDFADLVTRLPGVTQVGFPTYADALYIDNNSATLPSGLSSLNYGMKVYRHRVRGNNEWYNPKILWPGGPVTDETIALWAARLARFK